MSTDPFAIPTGAVDTRDMVVVHVAFRREYRLAPALVRGVTPDDEVRAGQRPRRAAELDVAPPPCRGGSAAVAETAGTRAC